MPDINLLQNSSNQKKIVEGGEVPSYLGVVGVIILVVVVLGTAAFYLLDSQQAKQLSSIQAQQITAQQKITSTANYSKFLAEQKSLTALTGLLQSHPDWSQVSNKFAAVTVKSVSYSSLSIDQNGTITIQGIAPNFAELDKYIEALSDKKISPFVTAVNLKNVSLSSQPSGTTASGVETSTAGVTFSVVVAFDKSIWQPSANTSSNAAATTNNSTINTTTTATGTQNQNSNQ